MPGVISLGLHNDLGDILSKLRFEFPENRIDMLHTQRGHMPPSHAVGDGALLEAPCKLLEIQWDVASRTVLIFDIPRLGWDCCHIEPGGQLELRLLSWNYGEKISIFPFLLNKSLFLISISLPGSRLLVYSI